MSEQKHSRTSKVLVYTVLALVLFGLLGAELFWLFQYGSGNLASKASALLALVGLYGLGIGFFTSSPTLHAFHDHARYLTSTNLADFVIGNLVFMAFILSIVSVGLNSRSEADAPQGLRFFGGTLWMLLFPLTLIYAAVHLLIVVPLSYIPNLLSSALVTAIAYSGSDVEVSTHQEGEETGSASVKNIVKHDPITAKGFLMGIPALSFSFLGKVLAPVIGS